MIYRQLGNTGIRVSEIGLGCEHLQGMDYDAVEAVVRAAIEGGVNILDVFMSEPQIRTDIGRAIHGVRGELVIQGHIGAIWQDGQYARSRDMDACRRFFGDLLKRLQTDYIDIGMIHFVDSSEDFESVFSSSVIEYALELKRTGTIRAIGISSHDPLIARKAVETGLIDVLMFSLNPAYDLMPEDTELMGLFETDMLEKAEFKGMNPARAELYALCARMGVGITVMKGLCGGMLLGAQSSPFGAALTPIQCIHYALTRPAVASVLVGCTSPEQVRAALAYHGADDAQRDFSAVLKSAPKYSSEGACVYCNHCLPCPSRIDIAQVNKYLDLATIGGDIPATVAEHYGALNARAGDCIECGDCEQRCPFGVPVIGRMRSAREVFGG